MDKSDLLRDSVKKLLSLGVSDDEIIESLAEVGVTREDAKKLIQEVRSGATVPKQPIGPEKVFEQTAQALGGGEPTQPMQPMKQPTQPQQVQQPAKEEPQFKPGQLEQTAKPSYVPPVVNPQQAPQQVQQQMPQQASQIEIQPQENKEINPMEVDFGIEMRESGNGEKKEESQEDINEQIIAQTQPQPVKSTTKLKPKETVVDDQPVIVPKMKPPIQHAKPSQPIEQTQPVQTVPVVENVQQDEEPQDANAIADKILAEVSKENAAHPVVPQPAPAPQPVREPPKLSDVKQSDVEELWKRGVVIAINAKLDEMRKLKDDIDEEIDSRVDSAVKKEINQFKVLLDSQKDLIISSNKEALMEKQKEITFIIDSKIVELKKYNREIEENIHAIEATKAEQQKAMRELDDSLDSVKKTKTTLIMEMNSELIKSKSQAQDFVDKSERHLKEMDERINKTLELEKNIAEGMLQKAEQKIETMTIARADDIIQELQVELNKVKAVEKEVSIETLDEKIKRLDQFKSEFIISMESNLTKINNAIERLNDKNATVEKELKGRMLIFDAKIDELTKFEKEFGSTMETFLKKESAKSNERQKPSASSSPTPPKDL